MRGRSYYVSSALNQRIHFFMLHVSMDVPGCAEILRWFITILGANFEIGNKDGKRPIHEAAQLSQQSCLHILLENSAQIDALKRSDWTPLMLACTKQSCEIVVALLEAGADPLLKNKDGWNSFHLACREGHLAIVEVLHRYCPASMYTKSKNLRTPLHTAALHGNTETVKWLLDQGSGQPFDQDSCGVIPLMDALRAGHITTAVAILNSLDLCHRNLTYDSNTISVEHLKRDKEDQFNVEDKMGRQAIHHAAQSGQVDAVNFLLSDCGVPVQSTSVLSGETPLHTAAQEGQRSVLKTLLSLGVDLNARDNRGRTALHKACGGQHISCALELLSFGSKNIKDNAGILPLQLIRSPDMKQTLEKHITKRETNRL